MFCELWLRDKLKKGSSKQGSNPMEDTGNFSGVHETIAEIV